MAFTQADADVLRQAIASGELTVTFSSPGGGSRSVTYRSIEDLTRALRLVEAELASATGGRPRTYSLIPAKGL